MNREEISLKLKQFKSLIEFDKEIYIPRRCDKADDHLQKLNKKLDNSRYIDAKEYTKDDISNIVKILYKLDENSPVLWKGIEILGAIGQNNDDAIRFLISCILPPQFDFLSWGTIQNYSEDKNLLDKLKILLSEVKLPKGKYIFLKAYYQLNRISENNEQSHELLRELYPCFTDDAHIQRIADALYPPFGSFDRENITQKIYSATFASSNTEEFVSYLDYISKHSGLEGL